MPPSAAAHRKRIAENARRVEDWNNLHPIGTHVRYWKGARQGEGRLSQTRTVAELVGGHTAVVWVTGEASCIALSYIKPVDPTAAA